MDINKQYSEVVRFIMEHRSGETAELMQKWGLSYNMTYGVSLAQILSFVKGKEKNNELAQKLWKENMRETKLISFHFFDATTLTSNELDALVKDFNNHELVEQGSLYLLVHSPYAAEKVGKWAESKEPYAKMTAYMLLARMAQKRKDVSPNFFGTFFENMEEDSTNANLFVRKSITLALLNTARTSDENKSKVYAFIDKISKFDSEYADFVVRTTSQELEYI